MAPLLTAEALGLRLGRATLLEDVSLRLRPGEVTAVLGRNGAGKTTLLSLLTGALAPTAGTVRLGEAPLATLAPLALARRRAVLSQHHTLSFGLAVADVVALGRAPHRGTRAARHDDAALEAVATRFGLAPFWRRLYPSLSGGERQRVQIARAAAQLWQPGPDRHDTLLFLDEPAAALDLAQQQGALDFAFETAGRGTAVLAVLHDPNHAARAHQVLLLRQGRLLAAGPPAATLTPDLLFDCLGVRLRMLREGAGRVCFVA